MSEAQRFEYPGRYFGRYCTDEREYEYARTLEMSNKHTLKMLNSIKSCEESEAVINARKASENARKASENARKVSENARKASENARKASENARKASENAKKASENFRNLLKQLKEQGLIEE